ncbi:MAG: hypothetical protein PHD76_12150 [Methylacidiphilales bacterium]|nr:hypothetical protein [Candidatus Methylacidiphilales bacterium]
MNESTPQFIVDPEDQPSGSKSAKGLKRGQSLLWPVLVVLLSLIFSTARDIITLEKRKEAVAQKNTQAAELLKRYGKQTKFVDSLKADLQRIAANDAIAAKIISDFFPKPIVAEPPKKEPGSASKAPSNF